MKHYAKLLAPAIFLAVIILSSCKKDGHDPLPNDNNNMVMFWNAKTSEVLTTPMPQPFRTRYFAIIQIAVHDALNNIRPKFKPYALTNESEQLASPDAAVASAAYWTIKGLNFQEEYDIDAWYNESLATVADGESKELGIALGKQAAEAIIANRANDGFTETVLISPTPPNGTNPGEYRSTIMAENNVPTQNLFPFRVLYNWGIVTRPYVIKSNDQFRPAGPYDVKSKEYAKDFNEVKTKGAMVGGNRTAEEEKISQFYSENRPSLLWNDFVRKAIGNKHLDAWKTARLFALMHVSMAEGVNACFNTGYHFYSWRPETAIRLAANDNNDDTQADEVWVPSKLENPSSPSPPVPSYVTPFAAYGGATAETLRLFFGSDETSINITTTSTNPAVADPKPSFHYTSYSKAARDNSLSMIYSGWDFRKSALDGEKMGKQIAEYVFTHHFGGK